MPYRTSATIVGSDGRVYRRPKRSKVRRKPSKPVAGPYRSESSVESIRDKATPADRKRATSGRKRTRKRVRRLETKDAREDAKRATKAVKKATASKPIETLQRAERKLERRPDPKLREATRRLRHALASQATARASEKTPEGTAERENFPGRELKKVAPRAYKKARRAAQAGGHRSSEGLGEPEDLTIAITSLAPTGGFVGALGKRGLQVGGKKLAQEIGEATAAKVEAKAAKASTKALNAGSGVRAGARLARRGVRRAAGKETKKLAEKSAKGAAARAARRTSARAAAAKSHSASAAVPGLKLGKVGGIQMLPVVRGHEQAIVHNPKKTAKTTARMVPGLVTGAAGAVAAPGIAAGRAGSEALHSAGVPGFKGYSGKEIAEPLTKEAKAQLDFAKQVAKVVTADDSKEVQRAVEDELGLLLPVMLGLQGSAIGKRIGKGRVTEAVRQIAEKARRARGVEHGPHRGKTPRVLEKTGQRKEAAQAVAKGRTRGNRELSDRQRGTVKAAQKASGNKRIVRKGVGRKGKIVKRSADLEMRDADVASFLQAHPMKMDDPKAMLAEVKRIKAKLKPIPEGAERLMSDDQLSTRDVIEHIERHPEVLSDPAVIETVRQYRRQGRHARENPELSPEHSERARFLTPATTRDIAFPEERFTESVRPLTRAEPTRGRLAKDVLKREARSDTKRAAKKRRKAATLEKRAAIMRRELETREKLNKDRLDLPPTRSQLRELNAVKAMERRGIVPRGSAPVGGHLQVVTPKRGKALSAAKTLPKQHERLRERIDKLDTQAADLREQAIIDEKIAEAKRKASKIDDPRLAQEFVDDVKRNLAAEGITELPEYAYRGPGRDRVAPVHGSKGAKLTNFPGKSKRRAGFAEEHGLVEEGLRPMIRDSIARPVSRRESYKAMREVLEGNRFEPGGKKHWKAQEADELFAGSDPVLNPKTWTKVDISLTKRVYDVLEKPGKDLGPEDFDLIADLQTAVREKKAEGKGHTYEIVRTAALDELMHQLSSDRVFPALAGLNRITTFAILGTSPAWAATQVVAEYAQAAVAQPKLLNPKYVRKLIREYNAMAPHKRQAFDSWVGVTTREIGRPEDLKLDLKAGDMDAAADAFSVWRQTKAGRIAREIPRSIVDIDRWKGGKLRMLTTLAKMDKDLNGRANTFLRGIKGMDDILAKALPEMRGKPLHEQAAYIAEHPKLSKHFQSYLDDVMGNWSALTKNEQLASQLVIFYPFMRMSMRWAFYSFPKRHPVKASMLYYLGQQNAVELEKFLGGSPSFFPEWAKVPLPTGDVMNLAGVAPGSNALIEALGGTEGPTGIAAAKVAHPALAALGTAVYGVTPLSGKQEKNSGWNALAQLLPTNLSAPGRALNEAVLPGGRKPAEGAGKISPIFGTERQDALDKLSAKLRGYGSAGRYVRSLAVRPLPTSGEDEKDSALLGRIMHQLEANSPSVHRGVAGDYADRIKNARIEGKAGLAGKLRKEGQKRLGGMEKTYDEANALLDKLFRKHGIPYQREDDLFMAEYGALEYGSKPKGDYEGISTGNGSGTGITFGSEGAGVNFGGRTRIRRKPKITFGG